MIDPVSRLPSQWEGSPLLQGLVRALALPPAGLVEQYEILRTAYQLDSAIGVQLDALGALLGRPRDGRDDDTYRAWLRAQELVLRSRGRPDDLLGILALTAPTAALDYSEGPGVVFLFAAPTGVSLDTLGQILDLAKAAGVRLWLLGSATSAVFRFDVGPGFDVGVWADSFASP